MLNLLLAPLVADATVGNLNLFLDKILDLSFCRKEHSNDPLGLYCGPFPD